MKKYLSIIAVLILAFSLTGCASRTPFTVDAFKAAATELELEIQDVDPAAMGQEGIVSVSVATKESFATQVIIFSTDAAASSLYSSMISSVAGEGSVVEKRIDSSTYNKIIAKNGTTFIAIIRINNTIFYSEDQGTGEVQSILKLLGSE